MSKDEAFGQRYNIAPNPFKGAQASVFSRFGQQAQSLAGIGGQGPAVVAESSVATKKLSGEATLALGLSKTVAGTGSRLAQIDEAMAGDAIDARAQIEQAKIAQRNNVSVIEHLSGGLVAMQQLTGLSRAMAKAGGDQTNTSIDNEVYEEEYERAALEEMNRVGVQSPDELDQRILARIHKGALDKARPKQSILSKGLNAFAGVLEDIPIVGDSLQALRRQNITEARVTKLAQENMQTADMIRKTMEETSAFMETMSDLYGNRIEVPWKHQQLYMNIAGDFAENTGSFINLMIPYITQGSNFRSPIPEIVDDDQNDVFDPLNEMTHGR